MPTPNYTDAQVTEMSEAYSANPSMDTVLQLTESLGKGKASIISKLVSLGIYQKQVKATGTKEAIIPKAHFVEQVQALIPQELPSLKNMTKVDLEHLLAFLEDS